MIDLLEKTPDIKLEEDNTKSIKSKTNNIIRIIGIMSLIIVIIGAGIGLICDYYSEENVFKRLSDEEKQTKSLALHLDEKYILLLFDQDQTKVRPHLYQYQVEYAKYYVLYDMNILALNEINIFTQMTKKCMLFKVSYLKTKFTNFQNIDIFEITVEPDTHQSYLLKGYDNKFYYIVKKNNDYIKKSKDQLNNDDRMLFYQI